MVEVQDTKEAVVINFRRKRSALLALEESKEGCFSKAEQCRHKAWARPKLSAVNASRPDKGNELAGQLRSYLYSTLSLYCFQHLSKRSTSIFMNCSHKVFQRVSLLRSLIWVIWTFLVPSWMFWGRKHRTYISATIRMLRVLISA